MRLPGLGPKTAARIWRELGVDRRSSSSRPQPSSSGCARWPDWAPRPRSACWPRSRPRRRRSRTARCSARGCRPCWRSSRRCASTPASTSSPRPGSVRRRRETFRDLDIIATADDPAALTEHFTKLPWVADVAAHGPTKATVLSNDGLRFDLRVVPPESYGNLLQHFTGLEGAQRRPPRAGRPRGALGLRVRRRERRDARGVPDPQRGGALRAPRLPVHPTRAARELGRARRGAEGRAAEAGRARRPTRGPPHATPPGRTTARTRSRRWSRRRARRGYDYLAVTDHSHYLRDGKLERYFEEIIALGKRVAPFRVLRGIEVNIKADGTLDVDDETLSPVRLGDGVPAHELQQEPDRAGARGDREPARRLHRPPHRPQDQPPSAGRRRGRPGDRGGARDRHVPRDQLPAGPARPPRRTRPGGGRGRASSWP